MKLLSRFSEMAERPPTPPKESSGFPSSQGSDPVQASSSETDAGLHTPNESPASGAVSKSSGRRSKRVGFQLGLSKLNNASCSSPDGPSSGRSNPPSRDSKPSRSILKPASEPTIEDSIDNTQGRDFPRKLERFSQQLAGADMSSRLDAYIALNDALKTYKNGPELRALAEKMPLLTGFIERDLSDAENTRSPRGTQLAAEVVKLVTTFLWSPTMGDQLPESLQLFVLTKSIAVIGSNKAPKTLVIPFLHLLAIQDFRPKILSIPKMDKIISLLRYLENRVKGKQITAHRLDVYKKLISQNRSVMLMRFRDWYEHVFNALMSSTKEIRARALSVGFEAGSEYGAEEQVTRVVSGLFNLPVESEGSEKRYGALFAEQMDEWLASKDEAIYVPQVWTCVILFLRHQPRPLERWTFILTWLKLMKKCFNSTDTEMRLQANRAWVRLIYAIGPCLSTGDSMVGLLCDPVRSQLDRSRDSDRETTKIRVSLVAVYCTLLYYTMRPGASSDTLDRYWRACVTPFFPASRDATTRFDIHTATEILCSLLGERSGKAWMPNRALGPLPIKPDEIPRLDCRWVRQRVRWILPVMKSILLDDTWWNITSDQPPSIRIWKCFIGALAEAGSKEIKVSSEAKVAVAELVGIFNSFLAECRSPEVFARFTKLVDIALSTLGSLPFTEPKMIHESGHCYRMAECPSNQARKLTNLHSPIATVLLLLLKKPGEEPNELAALAQPLHRVLQISLRSASSPRTRLRALREACSQTLSSTSTDTSSARRLVLWETVMQILMSELSASRSTEHTSDSRQALGFDVEDVIKIIELGCDLGEGENSSWITINELIASQLSFAGASSEASPPLIEALAKLFSNKLKAPFDEKVGGSAVRLIEATEWPQRLGIDGRARRTPGKRTPNSRTVLTDPYGSVYDMIGELLGSIYQTLSPSLTELCGSALAAVTDLIARTPLPILESALKKLGSGLNPMVVDPDGKQTVESEQAVKAFKKLFDLWSTVTIRIQELPRFDAATLGYLDEVLFVGLRSRHRALASLTIKAWNDTFGLQEHLEYDERLKDALYSLAGSTDIAIPGVCRGRAMGSALSMVKYLDTPADLVELSEKKDAGSKLFSEVNHAMDIDQRPPLAVLSNQQNVSTPARQKDIAKIHTTPRLRHDDSQIELAAITSSPPSLETIEAQLLTQRQREVRDRQHAEAAAMFPNVRSSPRAKWTEPKPDLPRLQLRADQDLEHSDIDESHSPTLPSPSGSLYLGSSPTPSQKRQTSRDRHVSTKEQVAAADLAERLENETVALQHPSDDSTYFSSYGMTFGEELLAIYDAPSGDTPAPGMGLPEPELQHWASNEPNDVELAVLQDMDFEPLMIAFEGPDLQAEATAHTTDTTHETADEERAEHNREPSSETEVQLPLGNLCTSVNSAIASPEKAGWSPIIKLPLKQTLQESTTGVESTQVEKQIFADIEEAAFRPPSSQSVHNSSWTHTLDEDLVPSVEPERGNTAEPCAQLPEGLIAQPFEDSSEQLAVEPSSEFKAEPSLPQAAEPEPRRSADPASQLSTERSLQPERATMPSRGNKRKRGKVQADNKAEPKRPRGRPRRQRTPEQEDESGSEQDCIVVASFKVNRPGKRAAPYASTVSSSQGSKEQPSSPRRLQSARATQARKRTRSDAAAEDAAERSEAKRHCTPTEGPWHGPEGAGKAREVSVDLSAGGTADVVASTPETAVPVRRSPAEAPAGHLGAALPTAGQYQAREVATGSSSIVECQVEIEAAPVALGPEECPADQCTADEHAAAEDVTNEHAPNDDTVDGQTAVDCATAQATPALDSDVVPLSEANVLATLMLCKEQLKSVQVGRLGDEIMAAALDLGRAVLEAKQRGLQARR